ncbi:MAG: hypothetical protein ACREX3_01875 [Gammaproteobacteria bacterium]
MIQTTNPRRARWWLPAVLLALAIATWLWLVLRSDAIELRVAGREEVVLEGERFDCPNRYLPDAPVRAFRDGDRKIQLIVPHHEAYRMMGPDLHNLALDCAPVFRSDLEADPARFNDREWLSSVYALDDERLVALVHMEYQGHRHPGRCRAGRYGDCWYNAITLAKSTDGGESFHHLSPPEHLVASLPSRYRPGQGPAGVFSPSNVVFRAEDGFYYVLVRVVPYGDANRRVCVLRTRDPSDPNAWRAWDGESFDYSFSNPYSDAGERPDSALCEPVATAEIQTMSQSVTFNTELDRFLLVGTASRIDPRSRRLQTGFYYSLSKDLIHWTERQLLLETGTPNTFECGDPDPLSYPSVIDPDSRSRNFETSGRRPYLYFVRIHMEDCRPTGYRDLVRLPIEIRKNDG